MKIFTNKAFNNEICKAEDRIRGEFYKEREVEEFRRNMWEFEKKVDALTARVAVLEDMRRENAERNFLANFVPTSEVSTCVQ